MLANKQKRGARMVVIDPRRTDTAEDADLFLGVRPGTDTALFSGLLVHLADHGALDRDYIEQHTSGFDEALARARQIAGSVAATALATGLSEADVAAFFQDVPRDRTRRHALFAGRQPVGAGHRQGQRDHQLPSRHRPDRQGRARRRSR